MIYHIWAGFVIGFVIKMDDKPQKMAISDKSFDKTKKINILQDFECPKAVERSIFMTGCVITYCLGLAGP